MSELAPLAALAALAAQVMQRAADLRLRLDDRRCGEIAAAAAPVLQAVRAFPVGDAEFAAQPQPYTYWLRQCATALGAR
ncbi:hypothetical protein [Cupriavidus sp. YAF13]|uniref:hypothetical protein n=1 Tax=Cupriavidus sp. YAF13 TaxID=3233075 RepID=UPI003F936116